MLRTAVLRKTASTLFVHAPSHKLTSKIIFAGAERCFSASSILRDAPATSTPAEASSAVAPAVPVEKSIPLLDEDEIDFEALRAAAKPITQAYQFESTIDYINPANLMAFLLETMQATTSLPFWAVIAGTTVLFKIAYFPVLAKTQQMTAKMANITPQINSLRVKQQRAQDRETAAYYQKEIERIQTTAGTSQLRTVALGFIQAAYALPTFFAITKLATSNPAMATGGFLWFKDLSLADPLMVLPVLSSAVTSATFLYNYYRNLDQQSAQMRAVGKYIMWFVILLQFVIVFVTMKMAAGIFMMWLPSSIMQFLSLYILSFPRVRAYYLIPVVNKAVKSTGPQNKLLDGILNKVAPSLGKKAQIIELKDTKLFSQKELSEMKKKTTTTTQEPDQKV